MHLEILFISLYSQFRLLTYLVSSCHDNRKQLLEGQKRGLLLKDLLTLGFRLLWIYSGPYTVCAAYGHACIEFLLNPQEAEAKAAAAEERERSINERLSQTLSRINVLEAQVLIANDFHLPPFIFKYYLISELFCRFLASGQNRLN